MRDRFVVLALVLAAAILLPHFASADQGGLRLARKDGVLSYYEGTVVVSGVYREKLRGSEVGNFTVGLVCFDVQGSTEKLIPRDQDPRSPWFCFSNGADARLALELPKTAPQGTCFVVGTATVRVSNYVVNKAETEVHDTARLDAVVDVGKASFKKECGL